MTKDELLAKIQGTIDEQQSKLEALKNKAMDESQEAIEDIRNAIAKLEPEIDQAKQKALEIADVADDKWDDLKDSLEQGWKDVFSNWGEELSGVRETVEQGLDHAQAKLTDSYQGILGKIKSFFS